MDRLIVDDGQGGWHLDRVQWDRLRSGNVITPDIYGMLFNGLLRLKEYEDTGLTPEQIREIDKAFTAQAKELMQYKRAEEEAQP